MTERFELFTTTINQIYKNLQRIKMLEMTEFNLKGTHVMCIFELHHNPEGLTVTQLSALCGEDKAAISRTIAELTQKKYVRSESQKKYRTPIFLTSEGHKIATRIDERVTKAVEAGSDGLTKRERDIFYRSLIKISDNLNNYRTDETGPTR